jgi:hypothetical protein
VIPGLFLFSAGEEARNNIALLYDIDVIGGKTPIQKICRW